MAKTPADKTGAADPVAKTENVGLGNAAIENSTREMTEEEKIEAAQKAAAEVRQRARGAKVRLLVGIRVLDLGDSRTPGKRSVIDESRFLQLEANSSEVDRWGAPDANMREANATDLTDIVGS